MLSNLSRRYTDGAVQIALPSPSLSSQLMEVKTPKNRCIGGGSFIASPS
jgi:hypothetical protein